METDPLHSPSFLGSFRIFCDGILASIQVRFELFSAELQEEKLRFIQILIWMCAALFAAVMTIVFASIALVYAFSERMRLAALCGLVALYLIAFLAILIAFRRYLARQPRPFASSLEELAKDRACIRPES